MKVYILFSYHSTNIDDGMLGNNILGVFSSSDEALFEGQMKIHKEFNTTAIVAHEPGSTYWDICTNFSTYCMYLYCVREYEVQ